MFYEKFLDLCSQRGVSPSRAAENAGLSKATVSAWKRNPDVHPSSSVIEKLCAYFDVPPQALLDPAKVPAALASTSASGDGGFYRRFAALCRSRGISPSRAAENAGLSKATVSKWKREPDSVPSGTVLGKLSAYFGVPASTLLGETPSAQQPVGDEALKFALFGGSGEITQEMFDEVRSFAQFVLEREQKKKGS